MDVRSKTTEHRAVKVAGSKRLCQERYSCSGSKAEFDCLDCGTRQCTECEIRLHASNPRFVDHDRVRIQQPQLPANAQQCGTWCNPINIAEYSCIECKGVLCGECNRAFHKGKLSKHHRRPIVVPSKRVETVYENTNTSSTPTPLVTDKLESESGVPRTSLKDTLKLHESQDSNAGEDFQSALYSPTLDTDSGLPALQKLEIPPEFKFELDSESSKESTLYAPTMDEMSSNEFHSLEDGLEKLMIRNLEKGDLDSDRFGESDEPSRLDFSPGHFFADSEKDSHGQQMTSNAKARLQAVSPQQGKMAHSSKPNPQAGFQPVAAFRESKRPLSGSTSSRPTSSDVNAKQMGSSNPKSESRLKTPVLASSTRDPNAVRPVASVMGTSQNSISSNEGDGEAESPRVSHSQKVATHGGVIRDDAESPRSSHSHKVATHGGVLRNDDAASRYQLKIKDSTIRYTPGFLLVDDNEHLQMDTAEQFAEHLRCSSNTPVKVVSIFGNTGDGKSHSLNHTFFGGQDVFRTSPAQDSCTIGIWAAYDSTTSVIVADTEGLLGVSSNENQRTRLLLKVLAISDVVVYRTRADRLHRDLFQFLGDASKAYSKHFNQELKAACERGHLNGSLTSLGPAVLVFHETTHTVPLGSDQPSPEDSLGVSADSILRERFKEYGLSIEAFSCVQYIGTQTITPPTDFRGLRKAILSHVRNDSVRSPRPPTVVYNALKVLNDKFSGKIDATVPSTFPDEYFTCSDHCLSCDARCTRTMNHGKDNIPHGSELRCRYQHQYDNQVFTCKTCYERGEEVLVVPKTSSSTDTSWLGLVKYAWSGYVLECPNCGIIYRSRQHWYGNLDPEQTAVRTEIRHVWPGGCTVLQGTHNAARRVVDGLSSVFETVGSVSARPTQMVTQWMTDQIAPAYWRPNAEIKVCYGCQLPFGEGDKIHHCRACGEGFCDECSAHEMPVAERGWGEKPVRVCEQCYVKKCQDPNAVISTPEGSAEQPVTVRKVGEAMQSTFSVLGNAMQYPLGFMLDAARPAYWVPDSDIIVCCCCQMEFTPKMSKHHCRSCGKGVCSECSAKRRPVPSRGWDEPVRVCDDCDKKQGQL